MVPSLWGSTWGMGVSLWSRASLFGKPISFHMGSWFLQLLVGTHEEDMERQEATNEDRSCLYGLEHTRLSVYRLGLPTGPVVRSPRAMDNCCTCKHISKRFNVGASVCTLSLQVKSNFNTIFMAEKQSSIWKSVKNNAGKFCNAHY